LFILLFSGCISDNFRNIPSPRGEWQDENNENRITFTNVSVTVADIYMDTDFFNGQSPPNGNIKRHCVFERLIGRDTNPIVGLVIYPKPSSKLPEAELEVVSYIPESYMTLTDGRITITFYKQ